MSPNKEVFVRFVARVNPGEGEGGLQIHLFKLKSKSAVSCTIKGDIFSTQCHSQNYSLRPMPQCLQTTSCRFQLFNYLPFVWTRRPQGCCWCRGWRWLGLALALADRTSSCRSPSKQKATLLILKVSNQEEKITTKWKACFSPDTAGERQRRRTPNTAMVLIILIKVYFLYCNNVYFSNSCFCISILIYLVSTLNNEHAIMSGIWAFLNWVLFFTCFWLQVKFTFAFQRPALDQVELWTEFIRKLLHVWICDAANE